MKPYWEVTPDEAGACLDATSWRYADLGYFRGGGWIVGRFSGTEPLLRIFCEMDTLARAQAATRTLERFLGLGAAL